MRRFLIPAVAAGVLASALVGGMATLGTGTAAAQAPATSAPAVSGAVATEATKAAKSTATTPAAYTYGPHGDERNTLDVYTPTKAVGKTGKNLPTVVLVHGGSWIMGNRATLDTESKQFASLGYVAISVDYRPATDAAWPAQRTDVRRALGWIHDNASKLNVDADRIVVLGSSAGAEIAVSALTRGHGSDLARGVVSLSAPLDKEMILDRAGRAANAKRLADVVTDSLLGCLPADCPEKYKASSPKTWVDDEDSPMLLFTSSKEWVNPQGTYDLHAANKKAGLSSKLVIVQGKVHARDYWDKAWPTIEKWIASRMQAKS